MTDEQLALRLKEIDDGLTKLPDEKSQTKAQRKERYNFLIEKNQIERIKEARAKGNVRQDVKLCMEYSAMKEIKNPILRHLAQIKFRNHILG